MKAKEYLNFESILPLLQERFGDIKKCNRKQIYRSSKGNIFAIKYSKLYNNDILWACYNLDTIESDNIEYLVIVASLLGIFIIPKKVLLEYQKQTSKLKYGHNIRIKYQTDKSYLYSSKNDKTIDITDFFIKFMMNNKDDDVQLDSIESIEDTINNLDIGTPKIIKSTGDLPEDITISSEDDINWLRSILAENFIRKGSKVLYRGHEDKNYRIKSTLVRNNDISSEKELLDIEKKGLELFNQNIFNKEWLKFKTNNTDEVLYKMSIARHLGLNNRLIDVTANLETAIWFAVCNPRNYEKDGELIVLIINDKLISQEHHFYFCNDGIHYMNIHFVADDVHDLPLGLQRKSKQFGHFIWVGDNLLKKEESEIEKAFQIIRCKIPAKDKIKLASLLYTDVYSGYDYHEQIVIINGQMKNNENK